MIFIWFSFLSEFVFKDLQSNVKVIPKKGVCAEFFSKIVCKQVFLCQFPFFLFSRILNENYTKCALIVYLEPFFSSLQVLIYLFVIYILSQIMQITIWVSSISFHAYAEITFQSTSDVSIYTYL